MNRRELLSSLAAGTATLVSPACSKTTVETHRLSDAQIEALLSAMYGLVLRPGEAAEVRQILASTKLKDDIDPRVQPAMYFDPEVEIA